MSVVLHDYWRSSASYRVRIALGLKGVAYRSEPVDLVAGAQTAPAHLARQPQGLVPALQIDGLMLTQSLAILDYLEETRPDPALLPRDAPGRARVRAIALAVACEIHPLSNLRVLARVEALAGPDARGRWNRGNIAKGLAAVAAMLEPGSFCHGAQPGYGDCVLMPQIYNARRWGVDLPPRIAEVEAACRDLPAFAAAHPDRFGPVPA